MAFVLTYDTLKVTIVNYLQNASAQVLANLDVFIMLAQRRLAKDAKVLGVETYYDGNLIATNASLAKPAGWKDTLSFMLINPAPIQTPVLLRSYEYCSLYNSSAQAAGPPLYYADFGYDYWSLAPIPDQNYAFRIAYFELPQLIDSNTQENWFTRNTPECLLYACLYETCIFLKTPESMDYWYKMYSDALAALGKEDIMRREDRYVNRAAD